MPAKKTLKPLPPVPDNYLATVVWRGTMNVSYMRVFPASVEGLGRAIAHARQSVKDSGGGDPGVYALYGDHDAHRIKLPKETP